ncbi:MAG: hypothetical protein ABEH65_07455 [Halobacteriales archaeon]
MSLLTRLRQWIRSLFGADETASPETAPTTETTTELTYVCAVCGTNVDSPDAACPLCKSTDIRSANDDDSNGAESANLGTETVQQTRVTDDDGAATKLQEMKASGEDLLDQYADRWEQLQSGDRYRVTLADGSVRHVDSKDEVRASLLRAYGHDADEIESE